VFDLLMLCLLLLLLLQGKQLVYSALNIISKVEPMPTAPKKCRMSLSVRQFTLPPAGQQAGAAATDYEVSSSSNSSGRQFRTAVVLEC
jgi:hypothetical protein